MLYQINTILVTLTLFLEIGKSYGLKKSEKIQTMPILTFCAVKNTEHKWVGYLPFDVKIKKIVKQLCFNVQGCEFHYLVTVRDCSHLTSTSFFVQIDFLSIAYQILSTFYKVPLHSWHQLSKTNSSSKK